MSLMAWVEKYINLGFACIPLKPRGKTPLLSEWKPYQTKRPTLQDWKSWIERWPNCNIGIITGEISNLVALDCDSPESYDKYRKDFDLPNTYTVETGRLFPGVGYHLYFKYNPELGKTFQIDNDHLKSNGGYIVAPPSIHESGKQYTVLNDIELAEFPIVEIQAIKEDVKKDRRSIKSLILDGAPEGSRNEAIARIAGTFLGMGMAKEDIFTSCLGINRTQFVPPLSDLEVKAVVESIYGYDTKIVYTPIEMPKPEGGFLEKYMQYAEPQTEAPSMFHSIVGMITLAAAIGNKRYMQWGEAKMFPNMWVLLLGPSSCLKKTASTYPLQALLSEVDRKIILPNKFSEEALIEVLSERSDGLFLWDEFKDMISALTKTYSDSIGFLTSLYDARVFPLLKKLRGRDPMEINDPAVSLLTSTPTDWLSGTIKRSDSEGGFMKRFFIVPGIEEGKSFPFPNKPNRELKQELINHIQQVQSLKSAEMRFTPKALDAYTVWYHDIKKRLYDKIEMQTYKERVKTYAVKLAMVHATSLDPVALDIDLKSVLFSIKAVEAGIYAYNDLITHHLAFSDFENQCHRFVKIMKKHGGIMTRSKIFAHMKIPKREIDNLIDYHLETGQMESKKINNGIQGRPGIAYHLSI